jgi:signal transduction histidine kinase/ligand-binding sensor domain-containing protein
MQSMTNQLSRLAKIAIFMMVASCATSQSQGPQFEVRDIHHTAWTFENGVGAVFEIQQDREGYLWLTTANGVVRFDGANFQSLEEATNYAIRNYDIRSVYLSPSGRIWFRTRTSGLILFEAGKAFDYAANTGCISSAVNSGMVEDLDRSLWIRAINGLYHLVGRICEQVGRESGYPGGFPAGLLVDRDGTVWVKAPSGALLSRKRGRQKFEMNQCVSGPSTKTAFLHDGPDGTIWLSDERGLRKLVFGKSDIPSQSYARKRKSPSLPTGDFGFAPDGSLWAVVGEGVSRFLRRQWDSDTGLDVSAGEATTATNGLTSNAIWNLKVDREGNVWVGTNSGLDRLRVTALKSIVPPNAQQHQFALAPGDHGSVWTGNADLSLMRVDAQGHTSVVKKTHIADCIRRDYKGAIWSFDDGPVKLWRSSLRGLEPVHFPEENEAKGVSLAVDRNNEPWINIRPGRTYHLRHGEWRNENEALGKRNGLLGAMTSDETGIVWLGFSNYLVRWDGTSLEKFSFPRGRLDISVATMAAHGDHVWIAGAGGILLFMRSEFYLMQFSNRDLPGRVSGVLETERGELWANGSSGITHVSAGELSRWLTNPASKVDGEHLDTFDGLPGFSAERFPEPSVVEATDGAVWFATTQGIAWLDGAALPLIRNPVPPPVFVTSIVANGRVYPTPSNVRLPKLTTNLAIRYTALSLAIPERVHFRYRLEGVDKAWDEPGTRREAFYTNLSPGNYKFRVIACNNDGVWNSTGASVEFQIEPAFYQTWWLKTASVLAALAVMAWVIRRRMQVAARSIHARLAERLDERERIARELHDTLLQGVLSASMQLDLAEDKLAKDSPARELVQRVLETLRGVTEEGRLALRGLRFQHAENNDLAKAFLRVKLEFPHKQAIVFRVVEQGVARVVRTEIRNEVYRIGREAIVNAYVHSEAATIEAEIQFARAQFSLIVRDDGRGIDPSIIQGGRDGHWGLLGIRERSQRIGATLKLRSRPGAGSEVELVVPGHIAFEDDSDTSAPRWLSWLGRERFSSTGSAGTKEGEKQDERRG